MVRGKKEKFQLVPALAVSPCGYRVSNEYPYKHSDLPSHFSRFFKNKSDRNEGEFFITSHFGWKGSCRHSLNVRQTMETPSVLAVIRWSPSAQRRCDPDRTMCIPTFSHFLIVNKLFSLTHTPHTPQRGMVQGCLPRRRRQGRKSPPSQSSLLLL